MDAAELVLLGTAATLGVAHTFLGVDHTVPILAVSRAERWSFAKTLLMTLVLGLAHVASAALLFGLAEVVGWPEGRLLGVETTRADLAARGLAVVGLLYGTLSLIRLLRRSSATETASPHQTGPAPLGSSSRGVAPFVVLASALGPCEPLLPLLAGKKVFALEGSLVLATFSAATLLTMLTVVALGTMSLRRLTLRVPPLQRLARWNHVLAGYTIMLTALLQCS
jgi:nickel/cobalt transporter (NicO) family protein